MWAQAGVVVTRTTADSDGRFSMRGVPAGTYRLVASRIPMTRSVSPAMQAEIALLQAIGGQRLPSSARRLPPPPGVSTLWVTADLVVGTGDVTQDLAMGEAPRVEGQVLTDEGVQLSPGQLESIAVTLLPAESAFLLRIFPDRVAPDGRFMTTGSPPGRHFLRFDGLPDGHYVSSVVHRDREYRDAPLDLSTGSISGVELWISNQPLGTVKGSVMWRGIPDENALVVVFPETARNPMAWVAQRVGDSASGPGGTFEVDGLLPGDYLAAAIPLERGDGWQDPDMLERLRAGAQRVSLQQGQSVSVSLVRPAG
jgi:hypothetical protein